MIRDGKERKTHSVANTLITNYSLIASIPREKRKNLQIKCLAFADDLVFVVQNREDIQKMLENLDEIAVKTSLIVSYEKTKYMEYML